MNILERFENKVDQFCETFKVLKEINKKKIYFHTTLANYERARI